MGYTIKSDHIHKHGYWNVPAPNGEHVRHFVYLDFVKHVTPNGHEWTIRVEGEWEEDEQPKLTFTSDGVREYAKSGPGHLACGYIGQTPVSWYAPVHGDFDAYVNALDAAWPAGKATSARDTSIETRIHEADPVAARRAQIEYDAWLHEHDNMD